MSSKLFELLFPTITETMAEEARNLVLNVLRALFHVDTEGDETHLIWKETLPGRYRQAGRKVNGVTVAVMGQSLNRRHVIWAVLTGQLVTPGCVLQVSPAYPGDKIKSKDARTWRLYSPEEAKQLRSARTPGALMKVPYTNHQGKRVANAVFRAPSDR